MRKVACTKCGGSPNTYVKDGEMIWRCTICGAEYRGGAPTVSDKVARPFQSRQPIFDKTEEGKE